MDPKQPHKPTSVPLSLSLSTCHTDNSSTQQAEQHWQIQSWIQTEQPGRTHLPGAHGWYRDPAPKCRGLEQSISLFKLPWVRRELPPHGSAPAISCCCCCFHQLGTKTGLFNPSNVLLCSSRVCSLCLIPHIDSMDSEMPFSSGSYHSIPCSSRFFQHEHFDQSPDSELGSNSE